MLLNLNIFIEKGYANENEDYSNIQKIILEKDAKIQNLNEGNNSILILEIYNLNKKIQILETKNSRLESLQIKLDSLEIKNKEYYSELKIKKSYIEILQKKYEGKSISSETHINDEISNSNTDNYQEKKTIEILENRIKHLEEVNNYLELIFIKSLEKNYMKLKENEELFKKIQKEKNGCNY